MTKLQECEDLAVYPIFEDVKGMFKTHFLQVNYSSCSLQAMFIFSNREFHVFFCLLSHQLGAYRSSEVRTPEDAGSLALGRIFLRVTPPAAERWCFSLLFFYCKTGWFGKDYPNWPKFWKSLKHKLEWIFCQGFDGFEDGFAFIFFFDVLF